MSKVFLETIKILDGEIFHLEYHQRRFESVFKKFKVQNNINLKDVIKPPKDGFYRCRVVYDLSHERQKIEVTYHEYKKRKINSFKIVFDDEIKYDLKSINRDSLDNLFAKRDEADEILIVKDSLISDTSIANIAFYKDTTWFTPKTPLLKGTTRQRYLDSDKLIEADIKVEDLKNYSKVALLNAMIGFDILDTYEFLI